MEPGLSLQRVLSHREREEVSARDSPRTVIVDHSVVVVQHSGRLNIPSKRAGLAQDPLSEDRRCVSGWVDVLWTGLS